MMELRKLSCPVCSYYSFNSVADLETHFKEFEEHHTAKILEKVPFVGPIICTMCRERRNWTFTFDTPEQLQEHVMKFPQWHKYEEGFSNVMDAEFTCNGECNQAGMKNVFPTYESFLKHLTDYHTPTMATDDVNHPSHYTAYKGLEIIDLTEQMNFNRGNAVKYIARAGLKSAETEIKDLQKAAWYINREIERLQKDV